MLIREQEFSLLKQLAKINSARGVSTGSLFGINAESVHFAFKRYKQNY